MSDILQAASLIVRLGLAVWEAVEKGDSGKTVGEIFAGVKTDHEEIEALRAIARAKYETRL